MKRLERFGVHATWRDRRHWSIDVGRLYAYRWCRGGPCWLPGPAPARHRFACGWQR